MQKCAWAQDTLLTAPAPVVTDQPLGVLATAGNPTATQAMGAVHDTLVSWLSRPRDGGNSARHPRPSQLAASVFRGPVAAE